MAARAERAVESMQGRQGCGRVEGVREEVVWWQVKVVLWGIFFLELWGIELGDGYACGIWCAVCGEVVDCIVRFLLLR